MNIEAAARALCRFAGKDPDSEIKVALPGGAYTTSGEKLWAKYCEPAKACVEAALSESKGQATQNEVAVIPTPNKQE